MDFDMAGINHQPFKIGLMYQRFQQTFPNAFVPPAAKASMRVLPIPIVGRQIPPWRPCAQNPEHRVDELPIIAGIASPCPFAPKQVRLQKLPNSIRYVVTPMC
jgi:hypothetical protein